MLAANTRGAAEHSTRAASAAAPLRSKSSVSGRELFALNTSGTAALLSLEPAGRAEQHTAGRASAARGIMPPRQRGRKPASSAAAAAAARTGGSRSPSPQPPQRQPLAAPRSGFAAATVLDVVGGICIALLAAEAAAGRWLALPQPADIPAAVGSAAGAGGSAAGQQAGGTRILFGSCNKLSCDAGRREQQQHAQQQTRGGMSVRLEEALLPQDIADSLYPSGQGCVHPAAAAAIWPAILQRAEGADAWLWCEQCLFRPIYTLKRVFYQDGLGTNIGNVDGNKRSVLRRAGDAVYADVRVSLADGLRLSSDENNFQLFREGTKPNPFIGASPRRLSGLLELLKNYPVSKNALFE